MARIIIVLPAYNEEGNIGTLLTRISESLSEPLLACHTIVVDDGSRDGTPQILDQLARRIPLTVIRHETNQGFGSAIRDGLSRAAETAGDADVIVSMDADESHHPGLIPGMMELIGQGCDVVIASRYRSESRVFGVPWHRRLLSFAASCLCRVLFPTAGVRDFTSGYRAYRAGMIKQAFSVYDGRLIEESGFPCMVDLLLKLRRLGAVFGEVPIQLRYDLKASKSQMRIARTVATTLRVLVRHRLGGSD